MSDFSTDPISIHWVYWAIAVIALIWHLPAIANVFIQMNPEMVAGSADPVQAILAKRPGWATAGFAVFAIAGTLGSFLLLLRRSSASLLFMISLVGAIVHFAGLIGLEGVVPSMTMGCVMSIIGAVFFIWHSRRCAVRGWTK